ncbi:MAG: RNA polymerase sigma factor [Pseudonocardiaceae bacterium]
MPADSGASADGREHRRRISAGFPSTLGQGNGKPLDAAGNCPTRCAYHRLVGRPGAIRNQLRQLTRGLAMSMTTTTPQVSDLLARASSGDSRAWEAIVRQYGGVVCGTVRSYRLQDDDALDAIQMTWLRLAENAHRVRFPERLGGWLATTARRECLRILHDRAKRACDPLDIDAVVDPAVGPEQHAIDLDTARALRDLVAGLAPRGRNLLRALFTDTPRTYAEIAHATGIPLGSIGPLRARALRQLRQLGTERNVHMHP